MAELLKKYLNNAMLLRTSLCAGAGRIGILCLLLPRQTVVLFWHEEAQDEAE